jgi:hypothetical protein
MRQSFIRFALPGKFLALRITASVPRGQRVKQPWKKRCDDFATVNDGKKTFGRR